MGVAYFKRVWPGGSDPRHYSSRHLSLVQVSSSLKVWKQQHVILLVGITIYSGNQKRIKFDFDSLIFLF